MPFKRFIYKSRHRLGKISCIKCGKRLVLGEVVYSRYHMNPRGWDRRRQVIGYYCQKCHDSFYYDADKPSNPPKEEVKPPLLSIKKC